MKNRSGNQHQSIRESKWRGYGECKETIFSDIKAKKFLDLKKDVSLKIERAYQGKKYNNNSNNADKTQL